MATENLTQPELHADDLRWELAPLDVAPEDFALECAEGYRALAQAALRALATANARERRSQERMARLVAELHELRAFLRAQDRAA